MGRYINASTLTCVFFSLSGTFSLFTQLFLAYPLDLILESVFTGNPSWAPPLGLITLPECHLSAFPRSGLYHST